MNPYRIILSLIIVNAAGISLRYFDLDTYFIFLGFRFHLSSLVPFLILLNEESLNKFYRSFRSPVFRKKILPALWIVLSLLIVMAVLFFLNEIRTADPDYFYEFGLSSIFDYPLYLLWNFPQLCLLFYTLLVFSGMTGFPYTNVFVGLVLLFGYELIPLDSAFNPADVISLLLLSLTISFFVTKLQNIYWFAAVLFSSVWSIILLFGTGSRLIINIFFAKEYGSWEGFFNSSKEISLFVSPLFFLILLLFITLYYFDSAGKTEKKDI